MTDVIDDTLPDEVKPEETTTVEETPAGAEAEQPSSEEEASAPSDGEDTPEEHPKKKGVQKRIDELVWRSNEAERRAEEANRKLAELESRLPKETKPENTGEPKLEDFEDYDEYIVAKAEYRLEQKRAKETEQQQQTERQRAHAQARQTFAERANEARSKYQDFDSVAFNQSVPITEVMEQVILNSEKGPEVAYYLGSNVQEALKIAQLDPLSVARELGKIEARLSLPQPRTTSNAPNPVKTIGTKERVSKSLEDMTYSDYRKARGY